MIVRINTTRPASAPPPELFLAYEEDARAVEVWAPFPIHLVLRAWYFRWHAIFPLIHLGILVVDERGYLNDARFTPVCCWFRGRVVRDKTYLTSTRHPARVIWQLGRSGRVALRLIWE
jgi:hypothetical protein